MDDLKKIHLYKDLCVLSGRLSTAEEVIDEAAVAIMEIAEKAECDTRRIAELEAERDALVESKKVMHENMLTVVGAGVGIKAQLEELEALAQAVVDRRKRMNVITREEEMLPEFIALAAALGEDK